MFCIKRNFFIVFLFIHCFFVNAQQERSNNTKLPRNWHLLSYDSTGYYGIEADKAYHYLNGLSLKPEKVTVAVIDGDLDVRHEDLKERIWINPRPGAKGYVGDVNGWNFLGNARGEMLYKTGSESFREYKRLRPVYEGIKLEQLKTRKQKAEYEYYLRMKKEAKIGSYLQFANYLKMVGEAYRRTDSLVRLHYPKYNVNVAEVQKMTVKDSAVMAVAAGLWRYADSVKWKDVYIRQMKESDLAVSRLKSLDDLSGPRDLTGDRYSMSDKYYGNAILTDSTSFHGTFVAGIIGAVRANSMGLDGIADSVAIMGIRAIPDGDEYDKDVAMAIRYAVDNGAKIINMSFGKYLSPKREWVDRAIHYAASRGVLMIHAAGNNGKNLDSVQIFPSGVRKARRCPLFIRVGASGPDGKAAAISNYSSKQVDVFAPGMRIYSTVPGGYHIADGTSLAAPVVSGLAALIWSYFPSLGPGDVVDIIRKSVRPVAGMEKLCATGGIVNAYEAVKIASERVKNKKRS